MFRNEERFKTVSTAKGGLQILFNTSFAIQTILIILIRLKKVEAISFCSATGSAEDRKVNILSLYV